MRKRPKVALLIESSRAYGRGLLRGIAAYTRTHRSWSTFVEPRGLDEPFPRWLKSWKGDGILARITDRPMAKLILQTGLPAIDLRGSVPGISIPVVGLDAAAAARLAFEHLRERGFRHFAFCSAAPQYHFSDERGEAFERLAREAGCSFSAFPPTGNGPCSAEWDQEQRALARWVAKLVKPVGILACHDERGVDLLNACRDLRIAVPDDVAVIGVDNDEVMCELAEPSLSSVDSNTEQIGYRAAELLEQLMAGKITLAEPTLIEPAGVVARRSTDAFAIDDPELASSMRFIRDHACDGINVEDVLQQTRLSRSTLERRFVALLGRSPSDEIVRLRLERVKQLLEETNYPLSQIAALAGIEHPEHLGRLFRRKFGKTPGQYRQAMRDVGRRPDRVKC
jgi:LacI family transcriptional regulator